MLKQQSRIVLIGGTGAIGRVLQDELKSRNIDYVLIGRDVSNYNFLKSRINKGDTVYYLATENRSNQWEDFKRVNLLGVKNIVKISKEKNVCKLVYVSTVVVFANGKIHKKLTGNYYVDSKVAGLNYIKRHLSKSIYIVYPGVVLYRDYRYKREIKTLIDKIKDKLGFFTQGGIMMMTGDRQRLFKYIYMDNLVSLLLDIKDQHEIMAVDGEMSVTKYINNAKRFTSFWPFIIPNWVLKIINLFIKNKFVLE